MKNNNLMKRHPLSAALALVIGVTVPGIALAQNNQESDEDSNSNSEQNQKMDTVVVTGSRLKRVEVEGPSPVTIITAEQIEKEGHLTVHDVLDTVSQNTGFTQNDFNANGGFTPNAAVVNLRGLGPGRTLLLINGRRANDYPFPYNGRSNFQNFNNIPAAAVKQIEILAGGASAIYGSDAVAGVVNVILKDNYDGHSLEVRGATAKEGGRDVFDVNLVGGHSGDRWDVIYAVEAYKSNPLFAHERNFMDSAADNPSPPGVGGAAGFGGYQPPIGIQIRRLNAAGTTLDYLNPTGANCNGSAFYRTFTFFRSVPGAGQPAGATLGVGCGYDRFPAEATVVNGNEDVSAYVHGSLDFENGMELWASLMAYQSDSKLSGGVEQWFGGPQPNATYYDPNLRARVFPIRALTPETYGGSAGTFQTFNEDSLDLAVGLNGEMFDNFSWNATISHSEYDAIRYRPRMTVDGATAYFLGDRLGTTGQGTYTGLTGIPNGLPVYATNLTRLYGVISPADYAAMSTRLRYGGYSEGTAANFTVTGDLFDLPAGPVGFAGVIEGNAQSYELETDPRLLPANRQIYNLTSTGGGGERDRYALGVEFGVPIFSTLRATLAGRYDKYDDITAVDDAKTWVAGLEYRPWESLLLRATRSTSFKAPDMHYVFSERSGAFGTVTDFARCARDNISSATCSAAGANYNYSAFTTSQGNPGLQEETGDSDTFGIVWDATESLSFTADYYDITLTNEVQVQGGTTILQDEYGCLTGNYPAGVNNGGPFPYAAGSAYCQNIASLISRDPTNDNRISEIRSGPINIALRRIQGIDGSVRYQWGTESWGDFSARLDWSHVLKQEFRARDGVNIQSYRDFNTNTDFRSRTRATFGWQKGDWDATLFVNRLGSFPIWNPTNTRVVNGEVADRTQPYFNYNIGAGYQVNEDLGVRVQVNNLFNNHGRFDPTFNSYPYFWQAYDPIGRTYGLQVNYDF